MTPEPIYLQVDVKLIPPYVVAVMDALLSSGYQAFVAGGAVRDIVIGRECDDWDVATDATPSEVEEIFGDLAIDTGKKHGTLTVKMEVTLTVEVTTFRMDGEYSDGRRPDNVEFSLDPYEDVVRRDFTMNGLFMDRTGMIIDWVDGIADIKNMTVRAIGDPAERFQQDKLRLMRLVRQATILGFEIEWNTFIDAELNSGLVTHCDGDAIRKEFNKILVHDKVREGMELFYITGILREIMPEVSDMYGYDQKNPHHLRNLWDHTMTAMECVPNTIPLRLAALLHDTGKLTSREIGDDGVAHYNRHHLNSEEFAYAICDRLKYSHEIRDKVCILVREHMSKHWTMPKSGIKRFIKRIGVDNLEELFQLQWADCVAARPPYNVVDWVQFQTEVFAIIEAEEPMEVTDLAINGHDLMSIGFKGKEIGDAQKFLLEIVLEAPEMNTKDSLLERAGNYYDDVTNL